jgi:hypothetical protein
MRRHVSYANVAATLALVFAMSGGAIAATGGFSSGGKLQACVNEEGTLKLLKSGKHCKKGQKTVAWNMTGPAGPAGTKGATGSGTPGTLGATGKEGPQGKEGTKGSPGPGIKWAVVKGDGTSIIAQSGGISISSHFTGGYYLNFGSPVAGHAISATIYDKGGFPPGAIATAPCGEGTSGATPDTLECTASGTNDIDHVFVTTLNTAGTQTDKPFYVEVFE